MTWLGSIDIGDHVRTTRETPDGVIMPGVSRGRVGIVRNIDGFFTRIATVEFLHGGSARVPVRNLARTFLQGGEDGGKKRKQRRRGFQLGMLILNVPLLVALASYFIDGGTLPGLAPAAFSAALGLLVAVLAHSPLLALCVLALLVAWARSRMSR